MSSFGRSDASLGFAASGGESSMAILNAKANGEGSLFREEECPTSNNSNGVKGGLS